MLSRWLVIRRRHRIQYSHSMAYEFECRKCEKTKWPPLQQKNLSLLYSLLHFLLTVNQYYTHSPAYMKSVEISFNPFSQLRRKKIKLAAAF